MEFADQFAQTFRDKPHVKPYRSDVALADWERLKEERIESIQLSDVLEHIPGNTGAAREFRWILDPGGKLAPSPAEAIGTQPAPRAVRP